MSSAEILDRVKRLFGFKRDNQLAELFGLSTGDFASRKKKGTIIFVVLNWAISSNQDLNYIFYGVESLPPTDETILSAIKILRADEKVSSVFRMTVDAYKHLLDDN